MIISSLFRPTQKVRKGGRGRRKQAIDEEIEEESVEEKPENAASSPAPFALILDIGKLQTGVGIAVRPRNTSKEDYSTRFPPPFLFKHTPTPLPPAPPPRVQVRT